MHNLYKFFISIWLKMNYLLYTSPYLFPISNIVREVLVVISRLAYFQQMMYFIFMYNGHKKVHSIKFQSIATPNGLIAILYGPVEGKRDGSAMLVQSQVLNQLQCFLFNPHGDILCVYGDPAYPLRRQLQCPFRGARLTNIQKAWNKSMSQVRVSVEWLFGDAMNYLKFLDLRKI